jgi:hypothetical protein
MGKEITGLTALIRASLPEGTKFNMDKMVEQISRKTTVNPSVIKNHMNQIVGQKHDPIIIIDKAKGTAVYKPVLKKQAEKNELDVELVKAINFIHKRAGFNFKVVMNDGSERTVTTEDCIRR